MADRPPRPPTPSHDAVNMGRRGSTRSDREHFQRHGPNAGRRRAPGRVEGFFALPQATLPVPLPGGGQLQLAGPAAQAALPLPGGMPSQSPFSPLPNAPALAMSYAQQHHTFQALLAWQTQAMQQQQMQQQMMLMQQQLHHQQQMQQMQQMVHAQMQQRQQPGPWANEPTELPSMGLEAQLSNRMLPSAESNDAAANNAWAADVFNIRTSPNLSEPLRTSPNFSESYTTNDSPAAPPHCNTTSLVNQLVTMLLTGY